MIIAEDFIWLHMPKTGGTATRDFLISHLKGRPFTSETKGANADNTAAHYSLSQRKKEDPSFTSQNKRILCGIRRLPSWLLSNVHYQISKNRDFGVQRRNLLRGEFKIDKAGIWMTADQRLSVFEPDRVDCWIRQEYMMQDLYTSFKGLETENCVNPTEVLEVPKKNQTQIPYVKRIDFWWTPTELHSLYDANPIWASLEKKLYGNTLY